MSGGIIVNADDLANFISTLRQFDDELADCMQSLDANFKRLGDVWRDEKYSEFEQRWMLAWLAMRRYLDAEPEHVGFLQRKLDAALDYLS